jgi:predicted nucleic acid-binding Zn ribbon protein
MARRTSSNGSPRQAASRQQARRIGTVTVLTAPLRPPATPLAGCLDALQLEWQRQGAMGGLWQRWASLAGPQLAPHCRPLRLQGSVLTVGAAPGPWLQALQYNRHQLLANLRAAGFAIREIRVAQHHAPALPELAAGLEASSWARHPSRVDVHGMGDCPQCGSPAPRGEMARWGSCSFCRRQGLQAAAPQ